MFDINAINSVSSAEPAQAWGEEVCGEPSMLVCEAALGNELRA